MLPTAVPRPGLAFVAAVSLALATGCGAADVAEPIATAGSGPSEPTSSTTVATTPSPASTAPDTNTIPSSAASVSTTVPTTTAPPAPTTTGAPEPTAIELPIPSGSFETGRDDLFVQLRSGDLELWSGALTTIPEERPDRLPEQRTLVAEYPDPFAVFSEGTGPNAVDHVAGEVGGTVVFGDCCEPISGNVVAATAVGDAAPIAGGFTPTLSPMGDLLGTANGNLISQTAADSTGAGRYRQLNQQPQQSYLNVADLTWSSNATAAADDDHMVLLAWDDDGWWLYDVDRSTLEPTPTLQLGVPPVSEAPDITMDFVGHGPNSEIVVAQGTPDTTRLRSFDPTTLAERAQLERSLPGSASSIRLADDGLGLLWVDGGSLFHLPAGDVEAVRLGTDILAAWFA